ncbi:MAG TPA: hypothetical protein VLT61_12165 [Anaeromyxobacteraceae bacterium]|nr:hypothetical protein [Anaeromyxobacteraceae bacterium]
MTLAPIDRIRALPREQRLAFYRALPPGLLASQRYKPEFFARAAQLELLNRQLATLEIITGGRRAGKTLVAVWIYLRYLLTGKLRCLYPRIIVATYDDARGTVLSGPSGLLTWCPEEHRPPNHKRLPQEITSLYFPTVDTEIAIISAEKPSKAISQGSGFSLLDDPAKMIDHVGETKAREMLKQARISNSEGPDPHLIIPTTPRGNGFLRSALTPGQLVGARVTHIGTTDDNTALSGAYRASLADLQAEDPSEFDGRLRDETPGALWKRAWIHRVPAAPELVRVVVAVDPADDDKAGSDETGIVVVGLGADGRLYVLADLTARHPTHIWPALVAWAFRRYQADAIVAETNRAAGLVRRCLAIEAPHVPIVEVQATRGKATRAEPLAMLYSRGEVSHVDGGPQLSRPGHEWIRVSVFDPATGQRTEVEVEVKRDRRGWETLEDELCGWDPRKRRSPNGLDALVWGAWYLRPPEPAPEATEEILSAPGRYAEDAPRGLPPGLPRFAGAYGRRGMR